MSQKNPSLGTIKCPTCSTEGADVRQTKRKGHHLYWQCGECGLNQPTGKVIQERLWRETEFHAGAQPLRPSNVAADAERATLPEFDPTEPEEQPNAEPQTPKAASRPARANPARGVGIALLGALGLGVFLAAK